jgi:hypothetical protein
MAQATMLSDDTFTLTAPLKVHCRALVLYSLPSVLEILLVVVVLVLVVLLLVVVLVVYILVYIASSTPGPAPARGAGVRSLRQACPVLFQG